MSSCGRDEGVGVRIGFSYALALGLVWVLLLILVFCLAPHRWFIEGTRNVQAPAD